MNKRQANKAGRALDRTLIGLIIIALLLSAKGFSDQNDRIDLLVKKHIQQQTKIEQLEFDNQRLYEVTAYQYQQVKELKAQTVKVKINGQPITQVEKPVINNEKPVIDSKEVHIHNKAENEDMSIIDDAPTVIVTTLVMIGSLVKILVPALP